MDKVIKWIQYKISWHLQSDIKMKPESIQSVALGEKPELGDIKREGIFQVEAI